MQDQSLKLGAIPNHFHREDQIVCERCMSQIASSGSPLVDGFHEYVYVTGQLIGLLIDSGVRLLVALARSVKFGLNRVGSIHASQTKKNVKDHVHENGQQVCEKCLTGFTSTGSTIIDHIGEYFHMAHEVMLLFAQFILIAGLGIGMVITALFPTLTGRRSAREESLNQQARERRQQRWEEHQREIELNRCKINSPELSQRMFLHNEELVEDDLQVREFKHIKDAVNRGEEDTEKAREASEELLRNRTELAEKNARRQRHFDKYRDKYFEAKVLHKEADDAEKDGDEEKHNRKRRDAYKAESDSQHSYRKFLNV
jgi:hypothetical protein